MYNYLGYIIEINSKACKALEYKKSELKGHTFLSILPSDKIVKNLVYFEDIISNEKKYPDFSLRTRITKHGKKKSFLIKPIRFKKFNFYVSLVKF